jgi:hypothetical protein
MASYKTCVDNYCKECIYDETQSGTWRKQVEECTHTKCPLYEVRPRTLKNSKGKLKVKEVL